MAIRLLSLLRRHLVFMTRNFAFTFSAVLLITIGVLVGLNIKGSLPSDSAARREANLNKIQEVIRLVSANYFEVVNTEKMVDDAIEGMLRGLDPHTFYITAEDMRAVNEQMQGSFQGIGIEFNIVEDTIYVVSPITGGPSDRLGIQAGDRIVKIEGQNVAGIGITNNDVMKKLRGAKGSRVRVSIRRTGFKDLIDYEIVRDDIPFLSVDYSFMVDKETGYIRVARFAETTIREFTDHLNRLKAQGMQNLILDLRNNPGGYLDRAKTMADMFLGDNKLIVYTQGRIPSSNQRYETSPIIKDFEQGGLVILINQGSASASEIVSGAVQDWDRGLIIGSRSFGKGLVQQQYPLADGSAIRVVISRYYTPSGRCIQKPYDKDSKNYDLEIIDRYESGELFDASKIKFPDSLKYTTNAGRTVYGGGGIMPDIFIPADTTGNSRYLTDLIAKGLIRTFALRYAEKHPEVKSRYRDGFEFSQKFQVTKELIDELVAFAAEKGVPYVAADYKNSEKYIHNNLKALIGRAYYNDDGFYPVTLSIDNAFQKALEMMPAARRLERTGKFKVKD